MHMVTASRQWTVEEVWALPADGNRYEVIDGELFVTPGPKRLHQDVALELHFALKTYLQPLGFARVYAAPSDILSGPRTLVQPDARLIERWRAGDTRPEIVTEKLEWHPVVTHPPFELDVAGLFAGIPEEE